MWSAVFVPNFTDLALSLYPRLVVPCLNEILGFWLVVVQMLGNGLLLLLYM